LPPELPKAYGVNESATLWGDPHIADPDRVEKENDKIISFDVKMWEMRGWLSVVVCRSIVFIIIYNKLNKKFSVKRIQIIILVHH
jgi:hypothetical protein